MSNNQIRTLCACSPDQEGFQTALPQNNSDLVLWAFFYMDYDRLAFANQDEVSKPGSTLGVRLLAERQV